MPAATVEFEIRLTDFSDYALRLLMYAGARGDQLVTIEETANLYGISRAHLMKVANQLTSEGFLEAVRERRWLPERRL